MSPCPAIHPALILQTQRRIITMLEGRHMQHNQLSHTRADNPRSRIPAVITGCFRRVGRLPADIDFGDLSYEGFSIRTDETLKIGELLWARISGIGPTAAIIRSCDDGKYSCEFQDPISRTIAYIPE